MVGAYKCSSNAGMKGRYEEGKRRRKKSRERRRQCTWLLSFYFKLFNKMSVNTGVGSRKTSAGKYLPLSKMFALECVACGGAFRLIESGSCLPKIAIIDLLSISITIFSSFR